jgi:two-component system, cell cycle sensor histidine kinase and response regulator CckA
VARVLVVDDDRVVRHLISEILRRGGHDVVAAAGADEALRLAADGTIELVVTDMTMPGMSGLELARALHGDRPGLPVLIVTGSGTDDMVADALARGAAGVVAKPFTHAELSRAVAEALAGI